MRIRTKLSLLFIGVTGCLLFLMAAAGYHVFQKYLTEKIDQRLTADLEDHAESLNNNLLGKKKLLEISWYNLEQVARNSHITVDMLSGYKQVDAEMTDMYFASKQGAFVDGSGWQPPLRYDPRLRPWYQAAIEAGQITTTEPYLDMVSEQMAIAVVMPVRNESGDIDGVVGADFLLSTLVNKLRWVESYDGGIAYLLDSKGNILVHSNGAQSDRVVAGLQLEQDERGVVSQILSEEAGLIRYERSGSSEAMLLCFKQVPAMNASLVMEVPEDVVYAPLRQFRDLFVLAVFVVLLTLLALSFPMLGRMTRPLESLVTQVKRVGEGDLKASVELFGYAELDELARCFNNMVESLRYSFAELNRQSRETIAQMHSFQEATSHLITQADSMGGLFEVITKDVNRLVGGEHSVISTVGADGTTWTVRQIAGESSLRMGDTFSIEEGIIGETLRRREIVFVRDYAQYSRALKKVREDGIASYIALPLRLETETVGALAVAWSSCMAAADAKRDAILQQYASIAAVAIARVRDHIEIYELAYTDTLTKLPNRYSFYQQVQRLLQSPGGRTGNLFLLDLDNLKLINDSLGHSQGDDCICYVAEILRRMFQTEGVVARLGGDEFGFWLPSGRQEDPGSVAERILRSIEGEGTLGEQRLQITASIGIASYPRDGKTLEELMQNADAALYEAKDGGKNIWRMCTGELMEKTREKLFLSNALRGAISGSEFSIVYQPIVDQNKQLVAFEALLRWQNGSYGAVSPAVFVPIAEQCGMMPAIGHWVLEQACAFAAKLRSCGLEKVRVHVNVSVKQMENPAFCGEVEEIINRGGPASTQVILEVTESVFMASMAQAITSLNQLKKAGFLLAMDDFGEGFSSLAQLLRLPFDSVKISRTLVQGLGSDPRHMQYIRAIVEMMHALGLKVVAEGVETPEEWESAAECVFDFVQGYYISFPLSDEDALVWTQQTRK